MNVEFLVEHLTDLVEAPGAVKRLRQLVLDLAVRGKLVAQNSGDETGHELLERILNEKRRREGCGSSSKGKRLDPLAEDEIPFAVPGSWAWARVRQITGDHGQAVPSQPFTYVDVSAIDNAHGVIAEARVVLPEDAPSRARKIVALGDVLYSCVRPYLLNVAVVDVDLTPAPVASTAFAVLDGFGLVDPRYLWIVLRSPYMVQCVETKMRGQAYPAINDSDFSRLPVPLPPLDEQRRIVTKVSELMALCDRLEAEQSECEDRLDGVVASSLHRLALPASSVHSDASEGIGREAQFVIDNITRLTSRPRHIEHMRSKLLEAAVVGRLSDGVWPASPDPLGSAASLQNGYAFKSEWFSTAGARLLRNANVHHGVLRWDDAVYLPECRLEEFERFRLNEGDIVLSLDRPFIVTGTKAARVSKDDIPCLLLQRVGRFIIDPSRLLPDYLLMWLHSPHFSSQINPGRSNGVPHVSSKEVEAALIFLPSIEEQQRLVALISQISKMCEELQAILVRRQEDTLAALSAALGDTSCSSEEALFVSEQAS